MTGVVIRVFVGRATTSIGDRGCHTFVGDLAVIRVFVGRATMSIGDRGCHTYVCRESHYEYW